MEVKLKDVLHLYLGSQYRIRYIDYLSNQFTVWSELTSSRLSKLDDLSIAEIQLQLRLLSSMTEEEANEFDLVDVQKGLLAFGHRLQMYMTPNQFKKCLDNHFDLFGLIESSQAINKSSIK